MYIFVLGVVGHLRAEDVEGGGEYSGGPFSTKVSPTKNSDDPGVGASDGGMIF